jgi:hypothetical protein
MTTVQQNRLSMYLAVLGVMAKYNAVWAAMTALAEMVTRLGDLTTSIQETSGVQGSPLTGIAGGKNRKRMAMMQKTLEIAGDLHAFAVKGGDTTLQAKCDLKITDLVRLGDTLIGPRCQEIHDLADTNAAALVSYGVEAADITALQTLIDAYQPLISTPRQAVAGRKEATGNIADDEAAADDLLNNELDKSMQKFSTKNATFFGEYTTARMIIDLGHPKSQTPSTPPTPTPTPTPQDCRAGLPACLPWRDARRGVRGF